MLPFLVSQMVWPAAAVVSNVLIEAGARVIVCGTALTIGLEPSKFKFLSAPRQAQTVGKVPTSIGDDALRLPESSAALGDYLRAWTPSQASHFLRSFLQVYPQAGPGSGGAVGASSSAGSLCLSDLDISDIPGLFPCA